MSSRCARRRQFLALRRVAVVGPMARSSRRTADRFIALTCDGAPLAHCRCRPGGRLGAPEGVRRLAAGARGCPEAQRVRRGSPALPRCTHTVPVAGGPTLTAVRLGSTVRSRNSGAGAAGTATSTHIVRLVTRSIRACMALRSSAQLPCHRGRRSRTTPYPTTAALGRRRTRPTPYPADVVPGRRRAPTSSAQIGGCTVRARRSRNVPTDESPGPRPE